MRNLGKGAVAMATALLAGGAVLLASGAFGAGAPEYFGDTDPVNLTVAQTAPTAYPNSATLAATFGSDAYDANLTYGKLGPAFYQADASTPTYTITPRQKGWGNPFQGYRLPWDPSWTVSKGVDGWTVVLTADHKTAVECWETRVTNGVPSCRYGAITDPAGSSLSIAGGPTGSGLSRLAGVITQQDWDDGIDHALVYGTPDNEPNSHVYPASTTDGDGSGPMREGDFMWMSKDGACANPSGLNQAQQMVYRALQDYGAFNVDNAETFGFLSEYHATAPGLSGTGYASLGALPWDSCLHVGTISQP